MNPKYSNYSHYSHYSEQTQKFESFFNDKMKDSAKMNYNYLNINKQQFPKWNGWKIIDAEKKKGLKIDEIDSYILDTLVINHYMLLYIKTFYD